MKFISTLFDNLSAFILVLVAIPPLIWVISVTFLGRALKKAREEVATNTKTSQDACNKKVEDAKKELNEAGDSIQRISSARKRLQEAEDNRKESEAQNKETIQKYNILSAFGSVVVPILMLLVALIITWLHPYYFVNLHILSPALVLVVGLIFGSIWQLYKVIKVIEDVAPSTDEAIMKSTIDALRQVFKEHDKTKMPILELSFKGPVPFEVIKSSEFTIVFYVRLVQGDAGRNAEVWFLAPKGFDYPSESTKWEQSAEHSIPNALTARVEFDRPLVPDIRYTRTVKIKVPDRPGEYTLEYSLKCEGFGGDSEGFKVIVIEKEREEEVPF